MKRSHCSLWLLTIICTLSVYVQAEDYILKLYLRDVDGNPVSGVEIKCAACNQSVPSKEGFVKLPLPVQTRPGDNIKLIVINRSASRDPWVILSPWDGDTIVPSFDTKSDKALTIILAPRSLMRSLTNKEERLQLEKMRQHNRDLVLQLATSDAASKSLTIERDQMRLRGLTSATRSILLSASTRDGNLNIATQRQVLLEQESPKHRMTPQQLDQAIRKSLGSSDDLLDQGLLAFYEGKTKEATSILSDAFKLSKPETADHAFLLGRSLYDQEKYIGAAEYFKIGASLRPDDTDALLWQGKSLLKEYELQAARELIDKIIEKHRDRPKAVITAYLELAEFSVIEFVMDSIPLEKAFENQEKYLQQALNLSEIAFGRNHTVTANVLRKLASKANTDSLKEKYLQDAVAIFQKNIPAQRIELAETMNELADVYIGRSELIAAEKILREALSIYLKMPELAKERIAKMKGSLAKVCRYRRKYAEADKLIQDAVALYENMLTKDSSNISALEGMIEIGKAGYHMDKIGEYKRRRWEIAELIYEPGSVQRASHLLDITDFSDSSEKWQEAMREASEIYERKGMKVMVQAVSIISDISNLADVKAQMLERLIPVNRCFSFGSIMAVALIDVIVVDIDDFDDFDDLDDASEKEKRQALKNYAERLLTGCSATNQLSDSMLSFPLIIRGVVHLVERQTIEAEKDFDRAFFLTKNDKGSLFRDNIPEILELVANEADEKYFTDKKAALQVREKLYLQSIELLKMNDDDKLPMLAEAYEKYADFCSGKLEKYDKAKELLHQALEVRQKVGGDDKKTLSALKSLELLLADSDERLKIYEEEMVILEKLSKPEWLGLKSAFVERAADGSLKLHLGGDLFEIDIARLTNNADIRKKSFSLYSRMLSLAGKLEINQSSLGELHRLYGRLLAENGQTSEAKKQFSLAISMLKDKSADAARLADCLTEYARLLRNQGQLAEAEKYEKEVEAIKKSK